MRARRARPPLGCRSHNHRGPSMRARRARPPLGCRSATPAAAAPRSGPRQKRLPPKAYPRDGAGKSRRAKGRRARPGARAKGPGPGARARGSGRGPRARGPGHTGERPSDGPGPDDRNGDSHDHSPGSRPRHTLNELRHGPGAHQSPANPAGSQIVTYKIAQAPRVRTLFTQPPIPPHMATKTRPASSTNGRTGDPDGDAKRAR